MTDKNDFYYKDKKLFNDFCKKYKYYPPILPAKKRIIVLGDLHGDFKLMIRLLKLGKLIDDNNKWIGNDTYVVQIGDQLDSCRSHEQKCDNSSMKSNDLLNETEPEDIKILNFLTDLNFEANNESGAVISLLGNHEILNVLGNMNYVSQNDIDKFVNYKNNSDSTILFNSGKEA